MCLYFWQNYADGHGELNMISITSFEILWKYFYSTVSFFEFDQKLNVRVFFHSLIIILWKISNEEYAVIRDNDYMLFDNDVWDIADYGGSFSLTWSF